MPNIGNNESDGQRLPDKEPLWAHVSGWSQLSGAMRTVSCVIPSHNDGNKLAKLLPRLSDSLTESGFPWEIIVIDAGSDDGTDRLLRSWGELPGFWSVTAAPQLGKSAHLVIGLEAARGDAVVLLDPQPRFPPSLLQQMIWRWEQGAQVVYAIDDGSTRTGELKSWDAFTVDQLIASREPMSMPHGSTEFALFDRRVVDYLLR